MKKTIAIIIMSIIILGLGGYIAYDKLYAGKEVEPEPTEETDATQKEELAPWLDYLLNTDGVKITKITGFEPMTINGTNDLEGELTIDELKDILTGKVTKYINACGRGGDGYSFDITYEKDGKEYVLSSIISHISKEGTHDKYDTDFLKALMESVTNTSDMTAECQGLDPVDDYHIDFDSDKLLSYLTD